MVYQMHPVRGRAQQFAPFKIPAKIWFTFALMVGTLLALLIVILANVE